MSKKMHMILMIAILLAINQTYFKNAIAFFCGGPFRVIYDVHPYPTPLTWENQIKKTQIVRQL